MHTKRFDLPSTSAAAVDPDSIFPPLPTWIQIPSVALSTQRRNVQTLTASSSLTVAAVPGPARSQIPAAAPSTQRRNAQPLTAAGCLGHIHHLSLRRSIRGSSTERCAAAYCGFEAVRRAQVWRDWCRHRVLRLGSAEWGAHHPSNLWHITGDGARHQLCGVRGPRKDRATRTREDFTLQPIDSVEELHSMERKLGEAQYMRDVLAYLQSKRLKMARGFIFSPQFLRSSLDQQAQ